MSEEMFAQLLELVGQAGEGGFILAVIYLLEGYFVTAAWITMTIIVVLRIVRVILCAQAAIQICYTIAPKYGVRVDSYFGMTASTLARLRNAVEANS